MTAKESAISGAPTEESRTERKCICPRFVGPRECIALRYRRDYHFGENTGHEEECECVCHEEDEADFDDNYDNDDAWGVP